MQRPDSRFQSQSFWRPYFVLILSLFLTACAAFYVSQATQEQDELRFDNMADQTRDALNAHLRTYIAVLRGGAGLINAANLQRFGTESQHNAPVAQMFISRAAFHDYVEKLRLQNDFPGLQGIGLSLRVPPEQKNSFISVMRRDDPAFKMWPALPAAAGAQWHTIVYLEPRDKRNQAALGFNMFSEPTRRAAMQQACDSGDAAASGKVFLKQEITRNKQAGFLIYMPIYRGPRAPTNTAARRARLLGFVYSPFRAGDFFQTLLDEDSQRHLLFQLYDGEADKAHLLYQSAAQAKDYEPQFQRTLDVDAGGRKWTLAIETRPAFDHDSNSFFASFTIIAGLFISAILFAVTWTQATSHVRVEQAAWELRQSEKEREKLLESERRARLEAEEASRAKDDFLATVSHELRTPLTSILGWANLLSHNMIQGEELQRGLQTIERNAQSQSQLIEDLLDMSRIVSGRLRIETELLDVTPILNAVLDAARPAAQAKNIELSQHYQATAARVMGDPHRLQQIVWNLLTNAIKFTPTGGRVELSLRHADTHLEIRVHDNGIGMESDFVPRAFDRFHQADSSVTRSHGGLGLGLAIVRHLIEMHGGEVSAQSDGLGKGSTFLVRLPVTKDGATPAVLQDHSPAITTPREAENDLIAKRLRDQKILVVEDDADSRQMIDLLLQKYGAQVQSAENVSTALQIFTEWRPDILISDIGLPDEDGYSLLRRVRALPEAKGGQTPAIALTAFARESDRAAAAEAGFQRHLAKPISPTQLAAAIALLLSETS